MTGKPFAESSARNRAPIQAVLEEVFADRRRVLELGAALRDAALERARKREARG